MPRGNGSCNHGNERFELGQALRGGKIARLDADRMRMIFSPLFQKAADRPPDTESIDRSTSDSSRVKPPGGSGSNPEGIQAGSTRLRWFDEVARDRTLIPAFGRDRMGSGGLESPEQILIDNPLVGLITNSGSAVQ